MRPLSRSLLVAGGLSEAVRLSGWSAPLSLHVETNAPPEALAALIRDVERETELVPGVRRVTVLERSGPRAWAENGWVRYEVEGVTWRVPWVVRFRKAWEGDRCFWWQAEGGTGRPEQRGALWLLPRCDGARLELRARTRSALPLLGGAATLFINPFFLAPTFHAWLRNLACAAASETVHQAESSY